MRVSLFSSAYAAVTLCLLLVFWHFQLATPHFLGYRLKVGLMCGQTLGCTRGNPAFMLVNLPRVSGCASEPLFGLLDGASSRPLRELRPLFGLFSHLAHGDTLCCLAVGPSITSIVRPYGAPSYMRGVHIPPTPLRECGRAAKRLAMLQRRHGSVDNRKTQTMKTN